MRVVVVAKHNTEYTREVEEWMRDFSHETGMETEWLDPETIEGEIFATSHDIVEYPSVVVVDQNSATLSKWSGQKLPQFEEVSYVARNV